MSYSVYDPFHGYNIDGPFPSLEGAVRCAVRYRKSNKGLNLQVKDSKGHVVASIVVKDDNRVYSRIPGFRFLKSLNLAAEIDWGFVEWNND